MPHPIERTSPAQLSGAPRTWFNTIIAAKGHPHADTAILLGILIVAVTALLWLKVTARSTEMPTGANLTVGQQQGMFYLAKPAPDHTGELYVSREGLDWRRLPTALPGTVHTLAAGRISSPIMYAATSAGLFATSDGGHTWNAVAVSQNARAETVTALAAHPTAADMVYVATAEPALYHVTDVGDSRQRVAAHGLGQRQIHQIVVSPSDSQVVLAHTDQGLFRSETAGERWNLVAGVPRSISTLAFVPGDPTVWLAGTQDAGVYRSLDDGHTWQAANIGVSGQSKVAVTALTVDPRQHGRLYLATARAQRGTASIYVSTDSGASWVKMHDLIPGSGVINEILPATNSDIRAVTSDGVRTLTVDVDTLLARLDSPYAAVRLHAARLLSVTALPAHAHILLDHLDDPDPEVARYLSRAVVRTGGSDDVLRELMRRAQTGAPIARQRAIAVLGQLRAADAVPVLAHILRTDADLAPASAEALAAIGTEPAWRTLRTALRSGTSESRREAAIRAFLGAGEHAVPALVTGLHDGDPAVRTHAATLLADIGSPRAIPTLRHLADDESPQVQAAAIHALGTLGDVRSRPGLAQLADAGDTSNVRRAAAQAVTQIDKDSQVLPDNAIQHESPIDFADVWRIVVLTVPWFLIIILLFVRRDTDTEEGTQTTPSQPTITESVPPAQ